MALFKGNIRRRVMAVVETKIAAGQEEYDEEAQQLDNQLAESIRAVTMANLDSKAAAQERIVSNIIG